MEYREIIAYDLNEASNLVWTVFSEYVAPGYSQEGIETFRKFIQPDELEKSLESGNYFMFGCYNGVKLVGVVAMRDLCHVSLLFVDKSYQGQGIAKELVLNAISRCIQEKLDISKISVYSSPYAVEIYKKLGFEVAGEHTTQNGITYIPMKMNISANKVGTPIRYIRKDELEDLLKLYKHLNKDDQELEINERLTALWEDILNDPSQHYLIAEADGKPVSSCVLVIIKNLTRGAKPYGLIENVVTHEDYRKKGYGSKLLNKALEIAQNKGCYKVMLMSGRGEKTLKFYEMLGFERGKKTGFIIKF